MVEKIKVELASHMAATSVVEGIQVSEEEERAYYEANLSQFEEGAQVRARHILVDSKEQAEQVAAEIADGLAFEEAAQKYSTCPSKDKGSIETQFGHHLIFVEDKKQASQRPFSQVQAQIHQQLVTARQQAAYQVKVEELSAAYGVERKDF